MNWSGLRSVLPNVTLRAHGAPSEVHGSVKFNLDKSFDQYEEFWRFHIVPCTNRPANVQWREGVAKEIGHIGQISYGIWTDLVDASESLEHVARGDFGNDYRHCRDCL